MALANIGLYFFKRGMTTLLVDWDLEAPGLERYFEERFHLNLPDLTQRPGLIDMIRTYLEEKKNSQAIDQDYPTLEKYLYVLDQNNDQKLMLLHAGKRSHGKLWKDYAEFVQNFDWVEFYEEWEGGAYLEWLREEFKSIADVILIDSRTGVTEMGGVTTQHLADNLVLICGANIENIDNTVRMAKSFTSDAIRTVRQGRELEIIVVPSRIDDSDSEGFGEFLQRLSATFSDVPMRALDDGYSMEAMLIPYLPAFSYRETLVFDDPEIEKKAGRLLEAYRRIASNMESLAPADASLFKGSSSTVGSQITVFLSYARQDRDRVEVVRDFLARNHIITTELPERSDYLSETTRELQSVDCVMAFVSGNSTRSKNFDRVLLMADDLNKPIIPILLEPAQIPLYLTRLQFIDFSQDTRTLQPFEQLLTAVSRFRYEDTKPRPSKTSTGRSVNQIYISYVRRDGNDLANRLSDYLRKDGYNTWIDSRDIQSGDDWVSVIERALSESDVIVVIISPEYNASKFARNELAYALQQKKVIIPIVSDNAQVPLLIMDRQYISFSGGFNEAYGELKRTLQQLPRN